MDGRTLRLVVSDPSAPARDRLAARACILALLAVGYVSFEATVAVLVGVAWGSAVITAIALLGLLAGLPGLVIAWRFSWPRITSRWAESWARRFVATELLLIAAYALLEPSRMLFDGRRVQLGQADVILAISGTLVMPLIGRAKQRMARALDSAALLGDGRQNVVCGALAMTVLIGLASNALLGTHWPEGAVAVAIAVYALWAAREAMRGASARSAVPGGRLLQS